MTTRDEFVRSMHSKLDLMNNQIDALAKTMSAKADYLEAGVRSEYQKQMDALVSKRDSARSKLGEIESSGEGAWQDLKAGVELAWDALGEAVRSAMSRFK